MQNLNLFFQQQLFHIPTECLIHKHALSRWRVKTMARVEQQYYRQMNRVWTTQKTDRLMLRNDSSPSHSFFFFKPALQKKGFRAMLDIVCSTEETDETSMYLTANHKTTPAISPELKECATRPQPVATLFWWEHSKDWEQHPGIIIASRQVKRTIVYIYTKWRKS